MFGPKWYGVGMEEEVLDGEELFSELIADYPSIDLVLCGHALGAARRVDERPDGTLVIQHLSNYQEREPCGGGEFLRVISFRRGGVSVRTHSPWLGQDLKDEANYFFDSWVPP